MTKTEIYPLAQRITVGRWEIDPAQPPGTLMVDEQLGLLLAADAITGQVVYTATDTLFETRAALTPDGDYLLMFPTNTAARPKGGSHYGHAPEKVNDLVAFRSADRGQSWEGPTIPFDIDYNQHGFIPLIPRNSTRIYAFGTQPVWGMYTRERGLHENAPIGYSYSDDDGYHWSEVRLIRPTNDPGYTGMSVMRMCETDAGTWLLGTHEGDWSYTPLMTRQYILRSEDQGATWELLPNPRHGGWAVRAYGRMDEGRPINLGGGKVYLMLRTPAGHLWHAWSNDDGKSWTRPAPTPLVHPDAPPMLFHLSDGRTLAAFHHNRHTVTPDMYMGLGSNPEAFMDRSEIWVSFSKDDGHTWSEPQFVFANALAPSFENPFRNYQCSYIDMFIDGDTVHLFVPHRWERALHLTFKEAACEKFPTANVIKAAVS
jgi:hypothetical protein